MNDLIQQINTQYQHEQHIQKGIDIEYLCPVCQQLISQKLNKPEPKA